MPVPSSRDREQLRQRLAAWLGDQLGEAVTVAELSIPEGTGMSSETLLATASRGADTLDLVVRMQPEAVDTPVFPAYDLDLQYRAMSWVAERSAVPVPPLRWFEPSDAPLGAPFFVMERVDGHAPTDMPPYVFGGWLADATPQQRAGLQDEMVKILVQLHGIPVDDAAMFLDRPQYGTGATTQHLAYQRWYYEWAREGERYPVIERALAWLDTNRPAERAVTLNWGDARIGNVLWQDFRPVAVLDWEMAALGVPEVDVMWSLHLHHFFHDLTAKYGMPDLLPGFLQFDDVVGRYEELSGRRLEDLQYWLVFAALRYAIVSIRTTMRGVRTGEMPAPETPDAGIMNADLLDSYLEGGRPR